MSFYSYHTADQSTNGWSTSSSMPLSFSHPHMRAAAGDSPFAALTPFPAAAASAAAPEHPYAHFAQPMHGLSMMGLESDNVVYRGMHTGESTMLMQPHEQQQTLGWQDAYNAPVLPSKKFEMPTLAVGPSPLPAAVAYNSQVQQQASFDLPAAPQHVERYTSFYSAAQPAAICKALRVAFQTMSSELRVEVTEEVSKAKFRGVCISDCGDSIPFIARVYRTASNCSAPAPYLVEVQRRCGSSVDFYRLYQKLVKSCGSVCLAPFDSSSKSVCGSTSFAPLPLPSLAGLSNSALDIPSALTLCAMSESKYMDTRREASRCMLQCARQCDLFPTTLGSAGTPAAPAPASVPLPSLSRASSTRSTASNSEEASSALWAALVGLLQSADAECARLGASILRTTFARKHANGLLDALASDRALLSTLLNKLAENHQSDDLNSTDALMHNAFRRELAHALAELSHKRGAATLTNVRSDAASLLKRFV